MTKRERKAGLADFDSIRAFVSDAYAAYGRWLVEWREGERRVVGVNVRESS